MRNALALAALIAAAPVSAADQWDTVKEKAKRSDWDAMSYKVSDVEQAPLVFYGLAKGILGTGDFTSTLTGYKGSVPLFEPTFSKPDATQAKAGIKFVMTLKPTVFRMFVTPENDPVVECVGKPCPTGTISLSKRLSITEIKALKDLKITGIVATSKISASLTGEKPAGPAYVEPPKPVGLSDFEKAAYEHLFAKADPAYAACSDAKNFDKCRAALGPAMAAYVAPAADKNPDLTAAELAYLKARLGAEGDKQFQAALAWNKQLGGKKYSDFVAKYRKAIADEAADYAKAADKATYAPATATAVTEVLKKEPAPLTGLEAEIALAYPKEDPNTLKFREVLLKLAQANDGGKPPKPLNNLAERLEAAKKNKAEYLTIQKSLMEDIQGYLSAKDPAKYVSKFGIQKSGIDEKLLLGAFCTPNMSQAGAVSGGKKPKALDQAKGAKTNGGGVMDGALYGVTQPSNPLLAKCSQYVAEEKVKEEKGKDNPGPNSLVINETPAPEATKSKKSTQANDGKALDNDADSGPSKVGDHVRAGATLGLGLGIISLFALMMGPIGWAVVAGAAVGGFGIGYGMDVLVNK